MLVGYCLSMPVYLIWGDDLAAREQSIKKLIEDIVDPVWLSINFSRLDGRDPSQASKALEEALTPPFGNGGRLVLVQSSPFCNGCSSNLAERFESCLGLLPEENYLVLSNINKPDGRLKTTKAIHKLVKSQLAMETKCLLPTVWDVAGQCVLVERIANNIGLKLSPEATNALVDAIGNDSSRITLELEKLSILSQSNSNEFKSDMISLNNVKALVEGISTNALQIGEALLECDLGKAFTRLHALLDSGEPALRIVATLSGQIRGWLWVSLLDEKGEKDVSLIAKAAGIANPKRIYVLRKQIQGHSPHRFLQMLVGLLEVEAALKRGVLPTDAFQDGLLSSPDFFASH